MQLGAPLDKAVCSRHIMHSRLLLFRTPNAQQDEAVYSRASTALKLNSGRALPAVQPSALCYWYGYLVVVVDLSMQDELAFKQMTHG